MAEQAASKGVTFPRRARGDARRPAAPHPRAGRWPRRGSAAPAIRPARAPNRPRPRPASGAPRGAPRAHGLVGELDAQVRPQDGQVEQIGAEARPRLLVRLFASWRSIWLRAPDLREAILELPGGGRRRRAGRVEEADAIGEAVELDGQLRPPVPFPRGDQPVPHLPGPGQEPIEAGAGIEQDEPVIEALGGLAMVARREVDPTLLELAHRIGEAAIGREPGDGPRRDEAQQGRHDRPGLRQGDGMVPVPLDPTLHQAAIRDAHQGPVVEVPPQVFREHGRVG